MENFINELIEIGMDNVIAMSVDKQITKDEIYQKNMEEAGNILDRLRPCLKEEEMQLFEDYMDCIMNANERSCNIAYLVGAKNTLQFLK